jgi:molybdopterin synthase sulfur carrier subunit
MADPQGTMPADETTGKPASVVVILPEALLRLFPGSMPRVEIQAATVRDAIDALEARWPGMRDRLCDSRPRVRRHINIFVAGERVTLETALPAGTEMIVLTAMRGG